MKHSLFISCFFTLTAGFAQSYPPAAEQPGSTAVHKDSSQFVAWATGITVQRGLVNFSNPDATAGGSNYATVGLPENATGFPDGSIVSLGDGGHAIATFNAAITNGPGFDFAVFENGSTAYLELAFVEVSSDGVNFFRFPNHSETQTETQIGSFGTPQAQYLNNIAGKYGAQYGTPFDISDLPDDSLLDKNNITHVKVVDVVGSVNPDYASYDSFDNAVNDSFPTPFASCGFDLQAVGVINQQVLSLPGLNTAKVVLYPNPAQGQLYIRSDFALNVELYDVAGRKVLSFKNSSANQPMDISGLKSGVYNVMVTLDARTEVLPLIVE